MTDAEKKRYNTIRAMVEDVANPRRQTPQTQQDNPIVPAAFAEFIETLDLPDDEVK